LRKAVVAVLRAVFLAHLFYVSATLLLIASYAFVTPSVTVLAVSRAVLDGWKIRRPYPATLSTVPKRTVRMLVSVEDGHFYEHFGIDPEAIRFAVGVNRSIGRNLYGGSTITMQLARTLFLVPEKSYLRKYLELIAALELELLLTKDRILELYLSWAEWGRGIFGIEAASRHYYGRSAARLGPAESAVLVTLLSSPIRYSPATLQKSAILRSRYAFLESRYLAAPQ